MAQENAGLKTFTSSEALAKFTRVVMANDKTVSYADAGVAYMGITQHACASGDPVTLRLLNYSGTVRIQMASTCTIGDSLYGADDGKASSSSSGTAQFTAMETATASTDIIEAQPAG